MSLTKRGLLAASATLAVIPAARAQTPGPPQGSNETLGERECMMCDSDGKLSHHRLNDAGDAAMKRYGRAFDSAALIYRSGGKQYVVENQRMADGSMLFDHRDDYFKNF